MAKGHRVLSKAIMKNNSGGGGESAGVSVSAKSVTAIEVMKKSVISNNVGDIEHE